MDQVGRCSGIEKRYVTPEKNGYRRKDCDAPAGYIITALRKPERTTETRHWLDAASRKRKREQTVENLEKLTPRALSQSRGTSTDVFLSYSSSNKWTFLSYVSLSFVQLMDGNKSTEGESAALSSGTGRGKDGVLERQNSKRNDETNVSLRALRAPRQKRPLIKVELH